MPRKLLSDSYRGWYGWEDLKSSVLRRSNCVLWDCRHKIDQEKMRHHIAMERLEERQKLEQLHARKAYESLQNEYSRIRAERTVLQHYAFRTCDPIHHDPPSPPPRSSSPQPRRPKTERPLYQSSPPKSQLVKRNSLPSTESLGTAQGNHARSQDKASVLRSAPGPIVPLLKKSATVASPASLTWANVGRKSLKKGRQFRSDTKESFFLTQSNISTSHKPEKDEEKEAEEGENEMFHEEQEQLLIQNAISHGSRVSSGNSAAICGPEVHTEETPSEEKTLEGHRFQSIDYILGAQKQPAQAAGKVTSIHFAKPSTPKGTIKPSNQKDQPKSSKPNGTDSSSGLVFPTSSSHSSTKQSTLSIVLDDRTKERFEGVPRNTQSFTEASQSHYFEAASNSKDTGPVLNKTDSTPGHERSSHASKSKNYHSQPPSIVQTSHSSPQETHPAEQKRPETTSIKPTISLIYRNGPRMPLLPSTLQSSKLTATAAEDTTTTPDPQPPPKPSLLAKFRQAAEAIVEEKREERENNTSLFAALLLHHPHRKLRIKALEKPAGVAEQEKEDLWKDMLTNVQNAVRWKAKVLRKSQGILNTRQMRRKAREQQQTKESGRRHVFPGQCKTTYAMKKFLSKEVEELVEASRPENRRKQHNKLLIERASIPKFVDRVRSTTAILRDFKQYQSSQTEDQMPVKISGLQAI